ncbi:hypothetical protein TAM4_2448 [Thermococcus sp. AM4]|nr:hypothetical protein TAM4_2448 [Thermococcus sp. AM4]
MIFHFAKKSSTIKTDVGNKAEALTRVTGISSPKIKMVRDQ